jgi:hypothetical protein
MNPHSNRVQQKPVFPVEALGDRKAKTPSLPALPEAVISDADASVTKPSSISGAADSSGERSSSCGDSEGHVQVVDQACPSPFRCGECSDVLHELANVMTGVVTNSQLLGWKLPPYSHLKRSVRELERGAQRSSELLKRLRERCPERP